MHDSAIVDDVDDKQRILKEVWKGDVAAVREGETMGERYLALVNAARESLAVVGMNIVLRKGPRYARAGWSQVVVCCRYDTCKIRQLDTQPLSSVC